MEKEFHDNPNKADMRKDTRKSYVTNVSYRVVVDEKSTIPVKDEGLTQNISNGGLCLILNRELPSGAVLELKFEMPEENSNSVETRVKVVWQEKMETGYLTGVKFDIG
jgi:hypothetical protein